LNNKNPSKYLIARINEYQLRYETQTCHPELNKLLNTIIKYILDSEKKHD
jgi:hypothetical protein